MQDIPGRGEGGGVGQASLLGGNARPLLTPHWMIAAPQGDLESGDSLIFSVLYLFLSLIFFLMTCLLSPQLSRPSFSLHTLAG